MKYVGHGWGVRASVIAVAVAVLLTACGGSEEGNGGQTDTGGMAKLAGTVSGLTADGLVISNGTDSVTLSANASSFELPAGGTLSIAHQPLGFTQACELGGTVSSPSVSCGEAVAKVSWAGGWGGVPQPNQPPMAGPDGRLYFVTNEFVYSALPSGEGGYRILAGSVYESGVADGTGDAARFRGPDSVTMDASGNLYALEADASGYAIRKVTPSGVVSTLASGLGGADPQLRNLVLGPNNQLYLLSFQQDLTYSVQRLTAQGQLEEVFNTGSMNTPNTPLLRGLAIGADGTLYLADTANYAIYKVAPGASTAELLAGSGTGASCYPDAQNQQSSTVCTDGTGTDARFGGISSLAINSQGVLYALDLDGTLVRRISANGSVTTIVGNAASPTNGNDDGNGAAATLGNSNGLSLSADGRTLYIGQGGTTDVRVVTNLDATGADVSTILSYANVLTQQPSTVKSAFFSRVSKVASDASGNLFVTDGGSSSGFFMATPTVIRKITPRGAVSTVGSSVLDIGNVRSLKVGADGLPLLVGLCSIERMALDGTVSTLTGNPATSRCRTSVDTAPNVTATVFNIIDAVPAAAGNVFFIEPGGVMRKLDSSGAITTLNLVDSNSNAFPTTSWAALAIGTQGEIYASTGNRVFKVVVQGRQGTVTLVAGNGGVGVTDGDALTQANFNGALAMGVDAAGNLYTADNYVNGGLVRQITPAGQVRTLAGGRNSNVSDRLDGLGGGARFGTIYTGALAVSSGGEVYVIDSSYLRKVEAVKAPAP